MILKGRYTLHLDGNFKKQFPEHGKRAFQDDDGKWFVHEFGPKYSNTLEVTVFDNAGLAWLRAHSEAGIVTPPDLPG